MDKQKVEMIVKGEKANMLLYNGPGTESDMNISADNDADVSFNSNTEQNSQSKSLDERLSIFRKHQKFSPNTPPKKTSTPGQPRTPPMELRVITLK